MDHKRFKATVRDFGGVRALSDQTKIKTTRLNDFQKGAAEPTRDEIVKLTRALNLTQWAFFDLFFPELVEGYDRAWRHGIRQPEPKRRRCIFRRNRQ